MAKKRRLAQRTGRRRQTTPSKSTVMSNTESSVSLSARPSSDVTASDMATSDGAHTAMTSLGDTDDELGEGNNLGGNGSLHGDGIDEEVELEEQEQDQVEEDEDDDDEDDDASMYPATYYPRASSPGRSALYFYPNEQHMTGSDIAASTRSIWAQDLDYRDIHGRRYCKEYFMPNDEIEQLRLALMHQVFLHVLEGDLTNVPLEDPSRILDVGTGTGEWAIRLAELFPHCEVTGTDISAIAETRRVPMNVFFEIEDAEDWDRPPDHFDLVHFRDMNGAFRDWRFIYDSVFYSLKPGGWIEVQDFNTSDGLDKFFSQFATNSPIHELFRDLKLGAEKAGRKRDIVHLEPNLLMLSGFVDARVMEYVIPITIAEMSIGKIWLIACLDSIEAACLRLLTEQMGWDPDKCKAACEEAARELATLAKNPEKANGLVIKVRVVVARKPFDTKPASSTEGSMEPEPSTEPRIDASSPDSLPIEASFT